MNTEPNTLDLLDSAVTAVGDLGLRRVADNRWERRSAQVWYRVWANSVADNQVQVFVGLVVPLLDRMLHRDADEATIAANLLQLAGAGNERTFELTGASRRGKLVARLRAPVLGTSAVRHVTVDDFASEVNTLLEQHYLPWGRLSNWGQLADLLSTEGAFLDKLGAVDDATRYEGVLRWAAGDPVTGRSLLERGGDRAADALIEALEGRFAQLAS